MATVLVSLPTNTVELSQVDDMGYRGTLEIRASGGDVGILGIYHLTLLRPVRCGYDIKCVIMNTSPCHCDIEYFFWNSP